MTAPVVDLDLPDVADPPEEPPKPAAERTPVENQIAKADAIAHALWRRGLGLRDVAHLPYTAKGKAPSLSRFARAAYREAAALPAYRQAWGEAPEHPPHSKDSPTWWLAARWIAGLAKLAADLPDDPRVPPRDLLEDAPTWTGRPPSAPSVSATPAASAAAAATPPTSTTPTAGASSRPDPASRSATPAGPSGPCPSASADGEPWFDPATRHIRYARSLGRCRACGDADLRWVSGPDGLIGLHRDPDPAGGWLVDEVALHARPAIDTDSGPRWVDHGTVCPQRPRARGEARAALGLGLDRCDHCGQELAFPGWSTCVTCPGPAGPRVPTQQHWVMDDGRRRATARSSPHRT